jgi:hypothetical protein
VKVKPTIVRVLTDKKKINFTLEGELQLTPGAPEKPIDRLRLFARFSFDA